LEDLLAGVTKARDELEPSPITARRPRLVLKIAPDLEESQIVDIAELIRNSKIDGVIVSNTTISRPASLRDCKSACRHTISFWLLINVIRDSQQIGGGWVVWCPFETACIAGFKNSAGAPSFEYSADRLRWD
jgi:hypothetical protein